MYEKKHPFLGLLVNYEEETDDDDGKDPDWLSQMFEYGFIRFIKLTSHDQISQFLQIIQKMFHRLTFLIFPSDVGAPCQNGKEIIGWKSSPQNI